MPSTRNKAQAPEPEPEEQEPPFYVATAPLPSGPRDAFPVFAFQVGDRVPPEMVGPNNWGDRVEVPEQFKGQLAPPPPPTPEDENGGDQPEPATKAGDKAKPEPEATAGAGDKEE